MTIPQRVLNLIRDRSNNRCEMCLTRATNTHHRRPRGLGGSKDPKTNLPANLVRLCGDGVTGCHGWVESNRAKAFEMGYLVHQGQDPATVPICLLVHGWVLLDNRGGLVPTSPPDSTEEAA